ncbi:MAG TPA: discoidin domain-containing protein [Tepidisphaeraceae bacterium]|nr:discoidin domain-containing protein [Tepidisphaeraceae bacterium]
MKLNKTLMWIMMCLVESAIVSAADLPANLAPSARITASSEHSAAYPAKNVADGKIPAAVCQDDVNQAWAVNGKTHAQGAEISFAWEKPVTVGEIVYYGRTGWFLEECWKDYQLYIDGNGGSLPPSQPLLKGQFEKVHGPQRIKLPAPVQTSKLTLKFTSSHSGLNPGASEIQIFPRALSEKEFARLTAAANPSMAWSQPPEILKLRDLIAELSKTHGNAYAKAGEHQFRLAQLETEAKSGRDIDQELVLLQREVLLFDVDRLLVVKRHEINASHVYTYHNEGFRAGGGIYAVAMHGANTAPKELVSSPSGQILDCDLSYDGKTVLFSWRKAESEGYHLWTVNIDGTGLKQLTQGEWHDYNGCWLPDGGIAFISTRSAQFAYCWNSPVGVVHRMDADGSHQRRLSGNYLNDFTPYPLNDGRIIYSRWEYVDKPAIPIQSMWTINPDGTGLSGYFGNRVISPATFMEARSIPGTTKVICTMTGHNGPTRGAIGIIDRTKGVNAQDAIWNITPDSPVPAVDKGDGNFWSSKLYSSPHPLDGTRFLVSARGPILVRNFSGTCQSIALTAPGDGLQYFSSAPVRPRARPPVPASVLAQEVGRALAVRKDPSTPASSQGYSSSLAPSDGERAGVRGDISGTAYLFLQDVYNGLEPIVKRGEVKRLRVVHELAKSVRINPDKRAFGFQFPVISAGATYAGKDVLGEVDVEPDGSAYFEVPAGLPIYFIALDADGRAVQRMRSFTHLMPGEVQGCTGCHINRDQSSPNQLLPNTAQLVLNRPVKKLTPPEWGTGGFNYAKVVQPVLDQWCVKCHSGVNPKAGLDLSGDLTDYFNVSYETLARGRRQSGEAQWDSPWVSWIPTYNGFETNILQVAPKRWGSPASKLADVLLRKDAAGNYRTKLDDAGRRRIFAWIDLNVPYYGSSETTHPDNLGSRRIYPADLDKTLASVAARRCANCHKDAKVPRQFWTRIENPQLNSFLLAPLAKSAGGTEKCGTPVFPNTDDPDYQSILKTFDPALASLKEKPRMDMPGAKPSLAVNRSCK